MLLKLAITPDAAEVADEIKARASLALERRHWRVLSVPMLADARRSPSVDIETLAARHPPLADFLGAARDEAEVLARATCAVGFETLAFHGDVVVLGEEVAAETPRV